MKSVSNQAIAQRSLVCGIGVNDAQYNTSQTVDGKRFACPYYAKWRAMIARCYATKRRDRNKTYADCTVATEWLTFSAFRDWMSQQDWKGKQMDKDIIKPGNTVYSPETCAFVRAETNYFLTNIKAEGRDLPVGVCRRPPNKFAAHCRNPVAGKNEFLGAFDSADDAHAAWRAQKHKHACRIAEREADARVKLALVNMFAPAAPVNGEGEQ